MSVASDVHPVLVADDDADDLFFARRALQKAGVIVPILTCADGGEVIALLKRMQAENKRPPETIFLDIKMPKFDGFQTLRWIRDQKHLRAVRVIMLSGSQEPRDVALARSLGANDYLVKFPTAEALSKALAAPGK
jgi:CheY-like chemotaxis protein